MSKKLTWIIILLFVFTRWFIWHYRPEAFTEILYSYMPYAHLWAGGEEPYLEHWFEYPPVTALWFYLPHVYDMATLEHPWHLPYLQAYRLMMMGVDVGVFTLLWLGLKKLKQPSHLLASALIYYSLVTAKAHHFIYDSMDLVFAGAIMLSVAGPLLFQGSKGIFLKWIGYFGGLGLKLANAPLMLPYLLSQRKHWRRELLLLFVAGMIIWGYPLIHYRSSLQVMLVYHRIRGLQIESVPATLARTINQFTHSEEIVEAYKNYEIKGPVSERVKQVFDPLFVLAVGIFTLYTSRKALRLSAIQQPVFFIWVTQGLILLVMSTAKVLSTPFLLWHIPLLALYPYRNWRQQLRFLIPSALIILLSMTPIPDLPVGPLSTHILISLYRSIAFVVLFVLWFRLQPKGRV
jgi:hypothetical protein